MVFALEVLLIFVIIGLQIYYFSLTYGRINRLKKLFPGFQLSGNHIRTIQFEDELCEQISIPDHKIDEFQEIIRATNSYLKKNKGSTDFAIIKNVAERVAEAQESAVTSNIGLPLYIGLMGTFIGVIVGLGVLISKPEFGNGEIKTFILGVVIAMIGSFFGLFFTTVNNSAVLKDAKAERDKNKNSYYNFLQTELLPNLDNSLYTALDSLKANINNFNTIFSKNIQAFDTTFSNRVDVLKDAVSEISQNIGVIVEGNQIQKDFLIEIRKKGYVKMAEASIEYFEKIKEAAPLLIGFIDKQNQLNHNIQNINLFAEKVAGLLNRISDFESGINQLGRDLRQSDLLGSEVLTLVRKHLNAIQHKEKLIEDYTIKSTDSVRQYLDEALERVQDLKRKLEMHFEQAFDFNTEGNVLKQLNHLSGIEQQVSLLVTQDANRKVDAQLYQFLSEIKSLLEEMKVQKSNGKEVNIVESANVAPGVISQIITDQGSIDLMQPSQTDKLAIPEAVSLIGDTKIVDSPVPERESAIVNEPIFTPPLPTIEEKVVEEEVLLIKDPIPSKESIQSNEPKEVITDKKKKKLWGLFG